MDEKTEHLRDIFLDVAGDATLTEEQEEHRGSLAAEDEDLDGRLTSVIRRMRRRDGFHTDLADETLVEIVKSFYSGENDSEIAGRLGDESNAETVADARVDLHLVTDSDLDAPFDLDDLEQALAEGVDASSIADGLDVDGSTVRRYRRILEAQRDRRVVADRFREEFEQILDDRALSDRMTADIKETGLEDATEGMETNVSF